MSNHEDTKLCHALRELCLYCSSMEAKGLNNSERNKGRKPDKFCFLLRHILFVMQSVIVCFKDHLSFACSSRYQFNKGCAGE